MQTNLKVDKIIQDLRQSLGKKWNDKIWTFLSSKSMVDIIEQLIEIKESGKFFVPSLKDALSPFIFTNPDKISVVIITSLKTNTVNLADGNRYPLQPNSVPIKKVLETISKKDSVDVNTWAAQGVLQISTAMTSTLQGEHHYNIWKPWVVYIINKINDLFPDTPVILIGKGAVQYKLMLKAADIFTVDIWPETDAHQCWWKVNDILLEQNKKPIKWVNEMNKIRIKDAATRREISDRQFYGAKKREREEKTKK